VIFYVYVFVFFGVWWIFTTQQQELETKLEYFVVDIWFFSLFEKEEGIFFFLNFYN